MIFTYKNCNVNLLSVSLVWKNSASSVSGCLFCQPVPKGPDFSGSADQSSKDVYYETFELKGHQMAAEDKDK